MLKQNLLKLDFTPNQADVYVALLDLGESKAGPIIRKTGFHRNIVYRALDDLEMRKLVSKITKRGVSSYQAIDPTPLIKEMVEKKTLAQEVVSEIKKKHKGTNIEFFVLTGHQGIIDMLNLVTTLGEPLYLIGANYVLLKTHPEYYPLYEKRLVQKNIHRHVLAQPGTEEYIPVFKNATTRILPSTFTASPLVIWIFGDHVCHAIWEQPETIFVLKNKKAADDYRRYFKILWEQSKSHHTS